MSAAEDFAPRLLAWFEQHGRHDLPWQHPRTPYRVWVSEIMLQQTRVETVLRYFDVFITRFPDCRALAEAPLDEVLHAWSGLGYYARARNLHRAARELVTRHGGEFPRERAPLEALPGCGRSTAAAILAQAWDIPEPILDGNVRRVLSRHAGVEGWWGETAVRAHLWTLAEARMPGQRAADYTQAIMDLGATVCPRSRPDCGRCPVAADCLARQQDRIAEFPTPRPGRALPTRARHAACVQGPTGIFLEQRAETGGVWGGLYSLPEDDDPERLRARIAAGWPDACECDGETVLRHAFSHYRLELHVLRFRLPAAGCGIMEAPGGIWYNPARPEPVGLPAPIARFLNDREDDEHG
jgi:A/G-specific adenine glycosylase